MNRSSFAILFMFAACVNAAPRDRITRPIEPTRLHVVHGGIHQLADPKSDNGAVDPSMQLHDVMIMFKPSAEQQADLERQLADQQNPSSAQYHKWLTPEDFANRFGLSASDHSKVVAWLHAQGFAVNRSARSRNWISFTGTAAQISKTLRTPIHRFSVNGKEFFSNVTIPSVPEALADVVDGFTGLDNFQMTSMMIPVTPDFNSGSSHFLSPDDFTTIYNVKPLAQAGLDGTGQSIAIVGQSNILLSDVRSFRTRFGLPVNDPKILLYSSTDPGFTGSQDEGNLDVQWAGAIAPKATIYYVYGPSAFSAIVATIEANLAPIISISYGTCEINASAPFYRSIMQQANAQGITVLSAGGDEGAACFDRGTFAQHGKALQFPSAVPEVTAVGGTQFVEGTGTYWASTNSPTGGSALSYIPEAAWNETSNTGIIAGGGGTSIVYPQPAWQNAPGVPQDGARHTPDISLDAALHDAYLITSNGGLAAVAGTSASAPSMSGIVALLNQYVVSKGIQKAPGLGNINPQLYRLAQAAPSVFHDIVNGDNIVPCQQGTPDCTTGSFGYKAIAGYDQATGLGSIDANAFVNQWNTATKAVTVTLSSDKTSGTINDTVALTVTVTPVSGGGSPTGTVHIVYNGLALGSAPLANGKATIPLPLYELGGAINATILAEYPGDAAFSGGGASARIQITLPTNATAAAILVTAPATVWPAVPAEAQGLVWAATITLREVAGVPAMVNAFTIDGTPQPLAQYFPTPNIAPGGTLPVNVLLRGLTGFVTHTYGFIGSDAKGQTWSRQASVSFYPTPLFSDFSLVATPLVMTQDITADPSCQWSVQVNVDDINGFPTSLNGFTVGGLNFLGNITPMFGTERLSEYSGLQGKLCFSNVTTPGIEQLYMTRSDGAFNLLTVSFADPNPNPVTLTPTPASVNLASAAGKTATANLALAISDKAQSWTATVFPANRTTGWLNLSQLSGVGPAQLTLTANGAGYEPGIYRATITLQSQNAVPQVINIPVTFLYGGDPTVSISSVSNSFSMTPTGAPGMLLSIFGSGLAGASPQTGTGPQYPYTLGGVSATVNGIAAPILYASATQVNIQIPYEAGSGFAVVGINNNGKIAGTSFQMAASAPGVFADAKGNAPPSSGVAAGSYGTVYLTGAGEVSPARLTGRAESLVASVPSLPKPVLPVSVTVGGVPVFIQYVGLGPGQIGTTQINFLVPPTLLPGQQPVVVKIGGVSSPPVLINVVAAGGK
jgi:uncharacterized protein (TIGR03437 family)